MKCLFCDSINIWDWHPFLLHEVYRPSYHFDMTIYSAVHLVTPITHNSPNFMPQSLCKWPPAYTTTDQRPVSILPLLLAGTSINFPPGSQSKSESKEPPCYELEYYKYAPCNLQCCSAGLALYACAHKYHVKMSDRMKECNCFQQE